MSKKLLCLFTFLLAFQFASAAKAARPNFVVFQVDDMVRSALAAQYKNSSGRKVSLLPNIQKYFIQGGARFSDFAAASPVCAPSRAALLSGRYPHNNRVVSNGGALGGALGWQNSPAWENNLPARLQEAGYHTGHFGKWTNYYGEETSDSVPPGWTTWVSDSTDSSTRDFYGYYQRWVIPRLGIDARKGPIGNPDYNNNQGIDSPSCRISMASVDSCNYHSDLMTRMAGSEIRATDEPFYMQIDYHAPHGDQANPAGPQPASRDLGLLNKVVLPKKPANFNEADTTDKDYLSQHKNGLMSDREKAAVDIFNRNALLSLKSVDQGIGYIASILKKRDLLKNTYLVFVSDNGLFYGEHRFVLGKLLMYEPASKVPFMIRGPGVKIGQNKYPASTIDFAPTIIDFAQARALPVDGQSLRSVISNPGPVPNRPRLIEYVSEGEIDGSDGWNDKLPQFPIDPARPADKSPAYRYRALQLGNYKYLSYDRGGEELYNLATDPREMNSLHKNPDYQQELSYMRGVLRSLRDCRGAQCRP